MTLENTDHRYLIWPDYPAAEPFPPQGSQGFRRGFERYERAGGGYITSIEAIEMIDSPAGIPLHDEAKNQLRGYIPSQARSSIKGGSSVGERREPLGLYHPPCGRSGSHGPYAAALVTKYTSTGVPTARSACFTTEP